ncbi:MAG: GNAT family N-acetyltransferase [Salaquimonas sp.]
MAVLIRRAKDEDWNQCWAIIEPVFAAGETYPYENVTKAEMRELWFEAPMVTYVALDEEERILGTYTLKPNVVGRGSHVCNCGYIVSKAARGQGIASQMCRHSQEQAIELGFKAMQFNFVVSTNAGAVALWQRLGFEIIGTLPKVFRHSKAGLVDAHVMFKQLV